MYLKVNVNLSIKKLKFKLFSLLFHQKDLFAMMPNSWSEARKSLNKFFNTHDVMSILPKVLYEAEAFEFCLTT